MDNSELPQSSALASLLESRLQDWEKARKPQELKLLECYQDVMRIPRDDDTQGTGTARSKKAKSLFIGSTRNKVRAARAKIIDSLLGNGQMPFDTTPTNEELAPYADLVEDIVTEQMERGGFKQLLKTGVNTLATYGTGFMFGPFVRQEKIVETKAEVIGPTTKLIETEFAFDLPYFELGNTLDVYPDPEAREIKTGLGCFWVTMESPHTVKAWKGLEGYTNIDQACQGSGDRGNETGSEMASQMRANIDFWFKNERVKVARFFGKVPKRYLSPGATAGETDDDGELVDAVVIMAGGVVVKVDKSPYGNKNPTHRCLYEAVEHEIWGVGVAENNAPHQKVTNAAFRLFMDGKGMALLGTSSVDRSKFLPTEDFKKFPGKVYQMKPNLSPDERKEAIVQHIEPDITGGWIDVIRMSEQFSDDDTGITKYTQGDDASNLNKTATGISMIMNASSLPLKEVIQNIDAMWVEPIVECYIDWNLKYLEPETVAKIHGEEAGARWAEIKQFGKSSFMDWQATGTGSFMQKEVLTNKIRAFAEFALSNPLTAQKVDPTELLNQTWDVMQIGKESPVLKEEEGGGVPPQVQEQMKQMQAQLQQLEKGLQEASQEHAEMTTQLQQKDIELAQTKAEKDIQAREFDLAQKQAAFDAQVAAQAQQPAPPEGVTPAAPASPMSGMSVVVQDPSGQVSGSISELGTGIAASQEMTQAGLASLIEGQQTLAEQIQQATQMAAAALEAAAAPRKSVIRIEKQPDGSFVGVKEEMPEVTNGA